MNLPLPFVSSPGGETWTVSDLNRYVRQSLEADYRLQDLRVRGEVTGFKAYPSGHWYFSLKDSSAQVDCVMWRPRAERQRFRPRDGDAVEASGAVTLYEARGKFQLDVSSLAPQGEGALYREFARLKTRLEAEGLFDAARKRPLPERPRRIGLITSPAGAALRDIVNVLRRRAPLAEALLAPAPVQGPEAPRAIVAALKHLGELPPAIRPDVVIIARGGGALEDLWAFNDEAVARAIAAAPIPVVSGVGHETDFTIADFVADVRAPTPSAAAEIVSRFSADDWRAEVDALTERAADALAAGLEARRAALGRLRERLERRSPTGQLALARQRLGELQMRARTALRHRLALARERQQRLAQALNAVSPLAVLGRGYAIVRRPSGEVIRQSATVRSGDALIVRVSEGRFGATATGELP